jgi:hypothetical protein
LHVQYLKLLEIRRQTRFETVSLNTAGTSRRVSKRVWRRISNGWQSFVKKLVVSRGRQTLLDQRRPLQKTCQVTTKIDSVASKSVRPADRRFQIVAPCGSPIPKSGRLRRPAEGAAAHSAAAKGQRTRHVKEQGTKDKG